MLAGDLIVLSFSILSMDETMDITPLIKQLAAVEGPGGLKLNPFKQELVYGEGVYAFGKEYKCMELLVNHQDSSCPRSSSRHTFGPSEATGRTKCPM